ncbi:MAG: DNA-directed RNA polymerase subunit D [Candidatus Micrarchaeia archaeon]
MKIDIIERNDKYMKFAFKDPKLGYANALRLYGAYGVPTFAIDKITVYENSSAMFDEYIAHRIGLVPIITPSKSKENMEVMFTLDATGPKTVYSRELESRDAEVKVANGNIPIIKLAEGQRLRLDGKAVLGQGFRHVKFQPGIVSYEQQDNNYIFYVEAFGQMPPIEIINNAIDKIRDDIADFKKELKNL